MTKNRYTKIVKINGIQITYSVDEEDKKPKNIFMVTNAGSELEKLLQIAGLQASRALQKGVPLKEIVDQWLNRLSEPSDVVEGYGPISSTSSPLDFAARLLALEYLGDLSVAQNPVDTSKLRYSQI